MKITEITPDYSVSPQITPEDVPEIAARGFRAIMCNRPDGEEAAQTDFAEIAAAAEAAGLTIVHVPVISGAITSDNLAEFDRALAGLPTPVLAYCRSGARSQSLWQLTRR